MLSQTLTIYKHNIHISELRRRKTAAQKHLLPNNKRPKTHCPVSRASMLPDALAQPVTKCLIASRLGSVAFLVLLILSATATYAHGTTVEHDLHIVHNVDNRSPEIDPFWYVGRGVRPIGRFGKRQSGSGLQPVVKSLELLLNTLRNKENLRSALAQDDSDWLP